MQVGKTQLRSIWSEGSKIKIIDQTLLPFRLKILQLSNLQDFADAIISMKVRGAPLIGVTALFGVANEMRIDASQRSLNNAVSKLSKTRPTAYNLFWALNEIKTYLSSISKAERYEAALSFANLKAEEDIERNKKIGKYCGEQILKSSSKETINIMTHCNAGWLATVDYGTALAPIFYLHEKKVNIHVFVSETRPRNQGAFLTAWELSNMKIPHTVIADNASGLILQKGLVDYVIVGSDRVIHSGEVFNKIGTYMKALACKEAKIPFYVCAPTSTIDWEDQSRGKDIIIEDRSPSEVTDIMALNVHNNRVGNYRIMNVDSNAINPAFDMTPRNFVTKIFTEKGGSTPGNLWKQKND